MRGGHGTDVPCSRPRIQIYHSTFLSGSNQVLDVNFGDGGVVSGNHIIVNNWTGLAISDSQNIIFEKNLVYSQNAPGQGPRGTSAGSGLSISRGNSRFGPSALSQNIYVGYNTFRNMGSNGQQVITNDGDGGSYIGPIAKSTADMVTLAHDPAWDWMGTTNPRRPALRSFREQGSDNIRSSRAIVVGRSILSSLGRLSLTQRQ